MFILEINKILKENTKNGDCPISYWDHNDQDDYYCNIKNIPCKGVLNHRPEGCPLKEMSDVPEDDLNMKDLSITTYRGGDENKVMVTHIPSGITTESNEFRSQHLNRKAALKKLVEKLISSPS